MSSCLLMWSITEFLCKLTTDLTSFWITKTWQGLFPFSLEDRGRSAVQQQIFFEMLKNWTSARHVYIITPGKGFSLKYEMQMSYLVCKWLQFILQGFWFDAISTLLQLIPTFLFGRPLAAISAMSLPPVYSPQIPILCQPLLIII